VGFDPFTDDAIADPYAHYARWRAEDPVHWSEKLRSWVLFRYEDVATAFRDDARFSADRRKATRAAGRGGDAPELRTVSSDPPDCVPIRAILNASLGPRVRAIAARLDEIVDDLLAGLAGRAGRDDVDLVEGFAHRLPITVIAELLDVPESQRAEFQERSRTIARGMDRFYAADDVADGLREIGAYFLGIVLERRGTPGDDVVRRLLEGAHRGDRLSDLEAVAMCTALVFAGNETTVNLVANGMLALLRRPAALARLRDDPDLVAPAIEELLRYDSPAQFISRVAAVDFELAGKRLRAGDSVLLCLGAANRDPAVFADPDRLDLARSPNPHLGFGLGTHVCPGAQLSRLEARAAIPALLARFPSIALGGAPPVRSRTAILRGLERLPVRLA
jgi:cytochrome P450